MCVCVCVHACARVQVCVCVCGKGGGWGALMGKSFLLLCHVLLLGALRLCKHDHCVLELVLQVIARPWAAARFICSG